MASNPFWRVITAEWKGVAVRFAKPHLWHTPNSSVVPAARQNLGGAPLRPENKGSDAVHRSLPDTEDSMLPPRGSPKEKPPMAALLEGAPNPPGGRRGPLSEEGRRGKKREGRR